MAIFGGHQKCVEMLIEAGANVNVIEAVSVVIRVLHIKAVYTLFMHDSASKSLDVYSVQEGFTALHAASQEGHCSVVRTLLEAKRDINITSIVSSIRFGTRAKMHSKSMTSHINTLNFCERVASDYIQFLIIQYYTYPAFVFLYRITKLLSTGQVTVDTMMW